MVGPAPGKRGEGKGVACRRGGEVIWGWDRAVGYAPTAERGGEAGDEAEPAGAGEGRDVGRGGVGRCLRV